MTAKGRHPRRWRGQLYKCDACSWIPASSEFAEWLADIKHRCGACLRDFSKPAAKQQKRPAARATALPTP